VSSSKEWNRSLAPAVTPPQTTFDRYGHLLPLKGDEVGLRLDATVFGGVKEAIQQT